MEPTLQLLDRLYREKIEAARRMTPEERVLASFELTEFVWQNILDGVRDQYPEASEAEVLRIACERVDRSR